MHGRRLDDATRRRWFGVAVAVLAAAVAVEALLLGDARPRDDARPRTVAPTPRPAVVGATAVVDTDGMVAGARAFLRWYLRYAIGDVDGTVAAGLLRTATPAFAAELLRQPARATRGGPSRPGVVATLAASGDGQTVTATVTRARVSTSLRLTVRRDGGVWRVADLR